VRFTHYSASIASIMAEPKLEPNTLEERARVHAALSDVGRLRIIDELMLGDAAPGELQHRLGLTSNLLAHHLSVLETAGLVLRHRSEADRRRSYVVLQHENLPTVTTMSSRSLPRPPERVVFVCTANSARSQLAAALWQEVSPIPTDSAGTHPATAVARGALATADRHGLTLHGATPRVLSDVLANGDFVITVCDNAFEELHEAGAARTPRHLQPALHWSVPDPVRSGTKRAFDQAYNDLARRVRNLAPRLADAS